MTKYDFYFILFHYRTFVFIVIDLQLLLKNG